MEMFKGVNVYASTVVSKIDITVVMLTEKKVVTGGEKRVWLATILHFYIVIYLFLLLLLNQNLDSHLQRHLTGALN